MSTNLYGTFQQAADGGAKDVVRNNNCELFQFFGLTGLQAIQAPPIPVLTVVLVSINASWGQVSVVAGVNALEHWVCCCRDQVPISGIVGPRLFYKLEHKLLLI
jgi:hypothetical protein